MSTTAEKHPPPDSGRRSATTPKKQRVQFYFEPDAVEALDELQDKTGLSTRAEVVRYGLRVFEWLVDEIQGENEVLIRKPNGDVQGLLLPFPKKTKV